MTTKPKPEIKCWKTRACGWRGMWADLVPREPTKSELKTEASLRGKLDIKINTCPRCGARDFYKAED